MAASMESRNQPRKRRAGSSVNFLLGVAVIPVAIWASRKYGDRLGRSWLMRRVAEEIAGRDLRVAMDSLAKISEFDRE
jgi:hypothetical protein